MEEYIESNHDFVEQLINQYFALYEGNIDFSHVFTNDYGVKIIYNINNNYE